MGDRHQRSAWFSGTVKATGKQNMHFLPLALLFMSACSDSPLPSVLQLLAIPRQTQGSTKQAGNEDDAFQTTPTWMDFGDILL